MPLHLALLTCVAAVWCGCAPSSAPVTTTDLPTPPFASQGTFNGGFETRIDVAAGRIRDQLARYGPLRIAETGDILRLDEGVGWPEVEAFYDSTFGRPPFDGFVRERVESPDPDRYAVAVWSSGSETLGVAVVHGQPDDPLSFLLRFRTLPE